MFSLVPDWSLLFHKDKFAFKKKSAKEASTFTGFCGYHDNSIFFELDNNEFDGGVRLTFLSAYRTLCREIFMKKGHLNTAHIGRSMDKGQSLERQMQIQEIVSATSDGANSALRELEDLKVHFEVALKNSAYDEFAFTNFHFAEKPELVSAGGFNPGHYLNGRFLQRLDVTTATQNVFFAILPDTTGFWASFLWLRSHSLMKQFVADVEQSFCSPGGIYAVALSHVENTFLRPSFWEGLPEQRKAAFHYLMMMDVLHRDYDRTKTVATELAAQYPLLTDPSHTRWVAVPSMSLLPRARRRGWPGQARP